MSWGIVAGVATGIGGALIGSRSADRAADAQQAGADQEIAFNRESRDMARQDQAPYREAGYTALDALMSLTGLSAPHRARTGQNPSGAASPAPTQVNATDYLSGLRGFGAIRGLMRERVRERYSGGPVGRETYNINELGPESLYEGGAYTRSPMPRTIAPSGDGYVKPAGRIFGGSFTGGLRQIQDVGWGGPNRLGGTTTDNNPPVAGPPPENPGGVAGDYQFQTDPGYQFRLGEGQRALERGAAAAGGLLSGGYARRAIRYGQDYASNEYTNVYNRIANIAGLGQVSAGASGNAALMAGANMGAAAGGAGATRASAYTAQGNAWGNALNQISQLPWGNVFNRGGGYDISHGGSRGPI